MSTILVFHRIGALADDLAAIPKTARKDMRSVVAEGIRVGKSLARDNAKAASGPHGSNYYKRITSEMNGNVSFGGVTGISGEYGPEGIPKSEFVGAGWRHGRNTDLEKSADVIAPAFYGEVQRLPDRWFW